MIQAEIRPCRPEDLEDLRRVSTETYEATFRGMTSEKTMDAYLGAAFSRDRLRDELANRCCRFFFLVCGGEISGYLKVNEAPAQTDLNDPDSLEIERLYIRAAFQGQGLGTTLIDHAVLSARGCNKRFIWLGVWQKNTRAIAFYRKMGFFLAGTHSFRMGDELQADFIMKKMLTD